MKTLNNPLKLTLLFIALLFVKTVDAQNNPSPNQIKFVRQAVKRYIFDDNQKITLAGLHPAEIIGMSAMHPVSHYSDHHADIKIQNNKLMIQSNEESLGSIWFGGFNPFATYTIDLISCEGKGEIGFEFSNHEKTEQFIVTLNYNENRLIDVNQKIIKESITVSSESILNNNIDSTLIEGKIILQMFGSGLTLFVQNSGLPQPIAQSEFANLLKALSQSDNYLSLADINYML